MGPLIPQEIINGDLNFFFALIIGIAFGFILEQAGFSSSRKLAGVFYGYDFVVLKVFFTAGITAATGLFFLKYMGWVNFDFLYINPLYIWSALVGGVIMGFGFILGGFCPGTSLTAAVIGKIDAWFFIFGMFVGVIIFGIFYPVFQPLHMGNFLGSPFIYDTLGLSPKWFLFFLVFMAVMAFAVTQIIEDNSTKFKDLLNTQKLKLTYPLFFILTLAVIALFLPQNRISFSGELNRKNLMEQLIKPTRYLDTEKIAFQIINEPQKLYLVDVRSQNEYNDFHLPNAVNIPAQTILNEGNHESFVKKNKKTVLYSGGSVNADMVWFFLTREGFNDIFVLEGGLNKFFTYIFNNQNLPDTTTIDGLSKIRFLEKTKTFFKEGKAQESENSKTVPMPSDSQLKAVKGGC